MMHAKHSAGSVARGAHTVFGNCSKFSLVEAVEVSEGMGVTVHASHRGPLFLLIPLESFYKTVHFFLLLLSEHCFFQGINDYLDA